MQCLEKGYNPSTTAWLFMHMWKTEGLKQVIDAEESLCFGAAPAVQKVRLKKVHLHSHPTPPADPKRQRPELWQVYNAWCSKSARLCACVPIFNWT